MPTSYGFAPGGTSFDIAAAAYVSLRTTLLTKDSANPPGTLNNLKEFVAELSGNQVQRPILDLMLASHGWSLGAMHLPLDDVDDADSYEKVDKHATAGTVVIPAGVTNPRPTVSGVAAGPCRVRVVGCWIGKFAPFLSRLKDALGGRVEVHAPKHEDAFYTRADGSAIFKGSLRYLLYDFRIHALTEFQDREALIDEFAKAHKFFNGKDIPRAVWKRAIPKDFNTQGRVTIGHEVAITPAIEKQKKITVYGEYDRGPDPAGPFPFLNGPKSTDSEAVRRAFVESILKTIDMYKPSHPLPMYVRDGFTSVDDFAKSYDWTPSPVDPNEWNGTRHRYMCTIPIWNPANTRKELLHDYFSKNGTVKRIGLKDNLDKLFTLV